MTTYSLAVWSDPGYVRRGPKPADPYFRPVGNYCREFAVVCPQLTNVAHPSTLTVAMSISPGICYISRRPGTIHCFDCDACVEEVQQAGSSIERPLAVLLCGISSHSLRVTPSCPQLDHHCSFIGKCVGKYTIHYYWWFIAAIIGNMVFSIASVFWWIVLVSQRRHMRMPGSYGSLI